MPNKDIGRAELAKIREKLTRKSSPDIPVANDRQAAARSTAPISDDLLEAYEERAAIMEYDGGLSREEAERAAMEIVTASVAEEHTPVGGGGYPGRMARR